MTDRELARALLQHLHREYPSKPGHVVASADEQRPIAEMSPVFRGSFDWHSSVHSHWALATLALDGGLDDAERDAATAALDISFEPARVAAELDQLDRPHRRGFELPYGMAWLVRLGATLADTAWAGATAALTDLAIERLGAWLARLPGPIRSGQHASSAFAMSLALESCRSLGAAHAGASALATAIEARAMAFHAGDRDAPLHWEPSAYDFLSPALSIAELMVGVLDDDRAGAWLDDFLPTYDHEPVGCADRDDGKLAHADGLNLSRGWMLAALARWRPSLEKAARDHWRAGLAGLEAASYAGTHWLPSFVVYGRRRGATLA